MKQVLDIEQMKHLRELGLDISKASMCWLKMNDVVSLSVHDEYCYESSLMEAMPAFTLQDILGMLPKEIITQHGTSYSLFIDYQEMHIAYCFVDREGMCWIVPAFDISDSLLDAAYEMLCWVIENGYLEEEK